MQGRSSSIVEIGRFQLQQFTVKELAEWFGLELSRIVVDERERGTAWGAAIASLGS
jgi:hypothetical protein